MPWREVSVSDQRIEFVALARLQDANVTELCERFAISRTTGYKWLQRRQAGDGLLLDRSRRPAHSPARTAAQAEAQVIAVRDEHPAWGARKIAAWLQRHRAIALAHSTVHAILRRHGRIAGQPDDAPGHTTRFEQDAPNRLWQMDFKGRVRLEAERWCHPLTILDDHSRFAVCLSACADQQSATVQERLERSFRHHGLPEALYVDNGSPWGGSGWGEWTRLGVYLLKLGIRVIHSRPYQPQGRGKSERFHRSLLDEVLAFRPPRDLATAQRRFDEWRQLYNHERPHEALGMAVPASRYRCSTRSLPNVLPQPSYDEREIVRRVGSTKAYVSFRGRLWKVPQAFAGELLALRPRGADGQYDVCFGAQRIAHIDLGSDP